MWEVCICIRCNYIKCLLFFFPFFFYWDITRKSVKCVEFLENSFKMSFLESRTENKILAQISSQTRVYSFTL